MHQGHADVSFFNLDFIYLYFLKYVTKHIETGLSVSENCLWNVISFISLVLVHSCEDSVTYQLLPRALLRLKGPARLASDFAMNRGAFLLLVSLTCLGFPNAITPGFLFKIADGSFSVFIRFFSACFFLSFYFKIFIEI